MNPDIKYYRLGVFVIGGFLILLLGLFALGAKGWFEPQVRFETYFDETISGLGVGAPVKFRGVTVGKVTRIDFTPNVYPVPPLTAAASPRFRYILVEFDIKRSMLHGMWHGDFQNYLDTAIKMGLRARVETTSLVGSNYLQLDRQDTAAPPLAIDWQPRFFYIPSAVSTITSVDRALRNLGQVDFGAMQQQLSQLLIRLDETGQQANILIRQVNLLDPAGVIDNLRVITGDVKDLTDRLRSDPSQIIWSSPPPPAKSLDKK